VSEHHADDAQRKAAHARAELLIPVVKGWCTELGNEMAGVGVQVHGGMGFNEETGAAQYVRDVRITTIYEGTTGIQANDLLGRKMGRDRGAALTALLQEMTAELGGMKPGDDTARAVVRAASEGVALLRDSTQAQLTALASAPDRALAVAVPFLMLCGFVLGGWLMAKAAVIAASKLSGSEAEFHAAKLRTALFYAEQVLPRSAALARIVKEGGSSVTGTDAGLI
jgi:acyl-CoA dehydrogenase